MATITAQEFADILSQSLAGLAQQTQATQEQIAQTQAQQAQATQELLEQGLQGVSQAVESVADIMNPYRGLTRQEILDEFRRIGFTNLSTLSADTLEVLTRKLNMAKAIDEQAEALEAYKTRTPAYIASDFSRSSFDTFVKTTEVSRTNTPLEQTYKFIPREIPEAHIKFIPERGLYELRQAGKVQYVKSFRDAERWALMGGEYATEMKELRRIRAMTERREVEKHIIFKARKV